MHLQIASIIFSVLHLSRSTELSKHHSSCTTLQGLMKYCKTLFFACPLFREFRENNEPRKFEYSSISV